MPYYMTNPADYNQYFQSSTSTFIRYLAAILDLSRFPVNKTPTRGLLRQNTVICMKLLCTQALTGFHCVGSLESWDARNVH